MPDKESLLSQREVQQLLSEMLEAFANYCERHHLRYYLVGGTLLGAVRHQGFIPWDDDIDVGMPRPDYERFLDLCESEPIAEQIAVRSDRDHTLSAPYCELVHTGTRLERQTSEYIYEKYQTLQLFIDIFPQDGWPSDETAARRLVRRMRLSRYMIQNGRAKPGHGTSAFRATAKMPLILYMKVRGVWPLIKKMHDIATQYDYDACEYVGAVTYGIYGMGERCLRREVLDFTHVTFEGRTYNAPGCWDSYLGGIYGDYMTLPPEEKRRDHRMKVWMTTNSSK